uniref:Uncharacterized protein n=1 Tax=Tanacetum cinerariifolium TaxID=118510 RepID=A0A6L2MS24_TANCI|nr:hypothetical protein [Tanacetum cinerariifolium]
MANHTRIYVPPSHTKKIFENIKRVGKGFSERDTPLFPTMMVQAQEELSEDIAIPTETHPTPTITQPSSSQPSRKQKPRKTKRQDTELPQTNVPIKIVADEAVNEEMYDSFEKATTTTTSLDADQDRDNINTMGDTIAQTRSENVSNFPNDPPLLRVNTLRSEEDRLKLKELMELCTKLSDRALNLETTKNAQAKEIANLKKIVKRLERKRESRSHGLKRLYKVGLSTRVESSANEESKDEEDSSKQGRISGINANQDINLDLQGVEVVVKEVNVASIATSITVAATTAVSFDELTLAQSLMEIKTSKPNEKRIVMQEPKPEMPLKKKAQISLDEEFAFKLQSKEDEQESIIKEKAQQIEEVNLTWDDVQAKIKADYEMRRKFFAAKRAKEKRNKPLTKDQQRSLMSTYLKNIDGWKTRTLKSKSFAEIKDLFDKAMTRINNFVNFRTELVEESTKKAQEEIAQESSSKIPGDELKLEIAKKQRIEDENESVKLKRCLEIVPDDRDDVTTDATPLSFKSPIIVDYKIYKERRKSFFQIIKADGNS